MAVLLATGMTSGAVAEGNAPAKNTSPQSGPTDSVGSVYGLAVDSPVADGGPKRLLLATDYGLLRASPDGYSERLNAPEAAISTLTSTWQAPRRFFLSGFAPDKSPLGVLSAGQSARGWKPVATGSAGSGALRALAISPMDPTRLLAIGDGIEISTDSGATWTQVATTPKETFAVAASSSDANTLFAATMTGLMISRDGGANWTVAYGDKTPVTMVTAASGKRLFAFVFGVGLIGATEPALNWKVLARGFEDRYLLHLSEDPDNPAILYASADTGALLTSRDGGASWISFDNSQNYTPARLAKGKQVFEDTCQVCHGVKGVGEDPGNPEAKDEYGFKAPALNNDTHAWHHSDPGIRATIENGSSRNKRMVAFKEILSPEEIDDVVVYIKSLWSLRSLACQGARHMTCLKQ